MVNFKFIFIKNRNENENNDDHHDEIEGSMGNSSFSLTHNNNSYSISVFQKPRLLDDLSNDRTINPRKQSMPTPWVGFNRNSNDVIFDQPLKKVRKNSENYDNELYKGWKKKETNTKISNNSFQISNGKIDSIFQDCFNSSQNIFSNKKPNHQKLSLQDFTIIENQNDIININDKMHNQRRATFHFGDDFVQTPLTNDNHKINNFCVQNSNSIVIEENNFSLSHQNLKIKQSLNDISNCSMKMNNSILDNSLSSTLINTKKKVFNNEISIDGSDKKSSSKKLKNSLKNKLNKKKTKKLNLEKEFSAFTSFVESIETKNNVKKKFSSFDIQLMKTICKSFDRTKVNKKKSKYSFVQSYSNKKTENKEQTQIISIIHLIKEFMSQ